MEENVSVDFAELAPHVGLLMIEKWLLEIKLARVRERKADNGVGSTTEIPAAT